MFRKKFSFGSGRLSLTMETVKHWELVVNGLLVTEEPAGKVRIELGEAIAM